MVTAVWVGLWTVRHPILAYPVVYVVSTALSATDSSDKNLGMRTKPAVEVYKVHIIFVLLLATVIVQPNV